jgi:hypothetical protein
LWRPAEQDTECVKRRAKTGEVTAFQSRTHVVIEPRDFKVARASRSPGANAGNGWQ